MSLAPPLFVGVDVGSGSVRAGLFDASGRLLQVAVQPIAVHNPEAEFFEQSSTDIWAKVVDTVSSVTKAVADKSAVKGLAFCSTCSLVAVGPSGEPVSVSKGGDPAWDVVMWMDHRAAAQAERINATGHPVLGYVGGKISLEMQTPKLLWLKENLRRSFDATGQFFDLGDWLRWRATGESARSLCCITCKWTYVNKPQGGGGGVGGWDETYFRQVGLDDVLPKISTGAFSHPGDHQALAPAVAAQLGLAPAATVVGFSMIDAHSGILGMIGCNEGTTRGQPGVGVDMSSRLAIICGTSNCHMALSRSCLPIPGVWGPYYGVILDGFHLSEGGQSAAGSLLDHVVKSHVAYAELLKECGGSHGKVLAGLESLLNSMGIGEADVFRALTADLHIWPDFHGNRSPIADPTLKGMISGLTLSATRESLASLYLATIQALAYGSRHIKETMEEHGHGFRQLVLCGGLVKSRLFLQLHADIVGLPVVVPACPEPVLLGAAMSARGAHEAAKAKGGVRGLQLEEVVSEMAGGWETVLHPNEALRCFHDKKYAVFKKMLADQLEYKTLMN